ncbi:MAG: pilus assembly protein PilM [Planctomycetaceae bacterium]
MIAVQPNQRTCSVETAQPPPPQRGAGARRVARVLTSGRPGWVGIDLGSRFLKIAQVVSDGGGLRVRAAEMIELSRSQRESGIDPAEIVSTVGGVLRSADILGTSVACLLPKSAYEHERVELPNCDGASIEQGLLRHLGRRSAPDLRGTSMDFWKIPGSKDSVEKTEHGVQVVSVRNDLVEQLIQGLHKSGYQVRCIDGPMMTAARAVELDDPANSDRNVAVVDWGHSTATFTLVSQGIPVLVRSLRDSDYARIIGAVSGRFEIDGNDAEVLLRRYGLPDVDERRPADEIRKAIFTHVRESLRVVCEELDRTIHYTSRKLSLAKPDRLVLTGGGAAVGNLSLWLQRRTGIETSHWSPASLKTDDHRSQPVAVFANAMALSALSLSPFRR